MGYVEKIMGDNEIEVYRTHQHLVVLLLREFSSLFAFVVFLALGLVILVPEADTAGNKIRFIIGVIALGSLVMPLYLIVSAWLQGMRGREFLRRIWRSALAGILILAVALVIMFQPELRLVGWIAFVIAFIPAFEIVRIFLDWLNERYIITNRRVMEVRGTINKHVRDSALEKVNDVDLKQSVVGRLLGYGSVQIITGSDIGINKFRRISKPVRFKRAMLNAKEQLHPAPAEETPPEAEAAIPDLIAELDELRRRGVLTEEEFQAKKSELLARL